MTDLNPEIETQAPVAPILREPGALVENIYPVPGTDSLPDLRSQDLMGQFLIDRFMPEEGPRLRVVLVPTGRTYPGLERTPAGIKEVGRWRKLMPKEWLVSPKAAAMVMVGSLALFNGVGNHDTIGGAAHRAAHEIDQFIDPSEDEVVLHERQVPGPVELIDMFADTNNSVGAAEPDPAVIQQFVDRIKNTEASGGIVLGINITGHASDEWNDEESVGQADAGNEALSLRRAEAAYAEAVANGLEIDSSAIEVGNTEHVLVHEVEAEMLALAQANGFNTVKEAIRAVDRGQNVSDELRSKVVDLFTGSARRGVSLTASVQYPGQEQTEIEREVVPADVEKPEIPDADFYGFIPMLPIRRRERYSKVKQLHKWNFVRSKQLYRPEILREEQDQAWVRLRPEAINEDGTFVENAWAYARKYEHLFKDGRIADLLRADFKDTEGKDRSLRVMFVDQAPAKETVEAFEKLLTKFAAMEDGKLGSRVSGIFVYPSENTGTDHGDPKRIGMGLDKQSPSEMLGTFTYPLNLVELHMPSAWDPDELDDLFASFNGPAWTASHEIAGHGTDQTDEQLRVTRIRTRNIPNAHIVEGEPRAHKMSRLNGILRRLPRPGEQKDIPAKFDITYPVTDNNGQTVTMRARVSEHDPRLAHATQTTIVGSRPTVYAGTSDPEHYAETAASVTTGIEVPYEEAMVFVPQLESDSGEQAVFAEGYRPDTLGQAVFTNSVGAIDGAFPAEFAEQPEVKIWHVNPANDSVLRSEMARMSRLSTLSPEQMIAILARVARSRD